jgi:Ran GTPase-activating protein (RanGAP) involved in mRNA processing and transport
MGSAGASTLAGALEGNSSLRALDVSSNAVTDVGAIALAKTLDTNTTLVSLSLHACLIGDKGAAALAATLQRGSVRLLAQILKSALYFDLYIVNIIGR